MSPLEKVNYSAFALTGRFVYACYPGRCPGLGADCPFRAHFFKWTHSWIFKSEYRPRKIVIREGVVEILGVAFWFNSRLRQVVLPSSLRIINSDAFAWCTSLREINIPESVEKIGSQCFEGCNLNC